MKDRAKALAELRERKMSELEEAIGHRFADRELLRLALTHSSLRDAFTQSNERLEFLGDSVVGLAIAQHLFTSFPALHEGELTKLKSMTVSAAALTAIGPTISATGTAMSGPTIESTTILRDGTRKESAGMERRPRRAIDAPSVPSTIAASTTRASARGETGSSHCSSVGEIDGATVS